MKYSQSAGRLNKVVNHNYTNQLYTGYTNHKRRFESTGAASGTNREAKNGSWSKGERKKKAWKSNSKGVLKTGFNATRSKKKSKSSRGLNNEDRVFNNSGINYHSTLNYIIKKSNQHKKKKYSASSQNIINQYQERSIPRIDEAENSEIERSRNPENFYEKSRMKFEPVNEPPYMYLRKKSGRNSRGKFRNKPNSMDSKTNLSKTRLLGMRRTSDKPKKLSLIQSMMVNSYNNDNSLTITNAPHKAIDKIPTRRSGELSEDKESNSARIRPQHNSELISKKKSSSHGRNIRSFNHRSNVSINNSYKKQESRRNNFLDSRKLKTHKKKNFSTSGIFRYPESASRPDSSGAELDLLKKGAGDYQSNLKAIPEKVRNQLLKSKGFMSRTNSRSKIKAQKAAKNEYLLKKELFRKSRRDKRAPSLLNSKFLRTFENKKKNQLGKNNEFKRKFKSMKNSMESITEDPPTKKNASGSLSKNRGVEKGLKGAPPHFKALKLQPEHIRFSVRTRKGRNPSMPSKQNQDSYLIRYKFMSSPYLHLFGVFDGHGLYGDQVSQFIEKHFPDILEKIIATNDAVSEQKPFEELIYLSIQKLVRKLSSSKIDTMFSGSTFNLCIIKKDLLYVTNIGDSRAVIGFEDSGTSFSKALSYDHHPDVEGERRRIIKNNGRISRIINKKGFGVGPLRVWLKTEDVPGLAMTRSIGDMVAGSIGVTWKPEIAIYRLCTEDRVLVVGSDGLWEMISNNTAVRILMNGIKDEGLEKSANRLMDTCLKKWEPQNVMDDVTFIAVSLGTP